MGYRNRQSKVKNKYKKYIEDKGKGKHKYFDPKKSEYIFDLDKQGKYISCKNECIKYLEEYPEDMSVICLLANCLRKVGDFTSARVLYDKVIKNKDLIDSPEYVVSNEIGLLIREERYEEAYEIFMENYKILEDIGAYVDLINLFLLKKLGKELPEVKPTESYQCMQLREYSRERCIEHVSKHFVEGFDVAGLVDFVCKMKSEAISYYPSLITEEVFFKYDHIGNYSSDFNSDILKAIFFHGTNELITIYSADNIDRYDTLDITPIKVNEENDVIIKMLKK